MTKLSQFQITNWSISLGSGDADEPHVYLGSHVLQSSVVVPANFDQFFRRHVRSTHFLPWRRGNRRCTTFPVAFSLVALLHSPSAATIQIWAAYFHEHGHVPPCALIWTQFSRSISVVIATIFACTPPVTAIASPHLMKAQSPEVVAAADLSPLSPSPLHTSSPRTVFNLQDHAKTLDVASLDSPAAAKYATMASNPEPAEMSDTIVVGGDYSDDSQGLSVADDDSFDAYSEGDDGQAQKNQPDVGNDDYARTFDSPPQAQNEDEPDEPVHEHEHEAEPATQPDVPKASESMNSSSAPDTLKSQSPAAAAAAAPASAPAPISHSSPSPDSSRPGSPVQQHLGSTENSTEPSAEPGAAAAEAPPPEPAADNSLKSPAITSAGEEPASASAGDDKSTVDIQKLVDDITARATTASAAKPPTSQSPPTVSQPLPAPLNVSQPTSLPPRPSSPARQSDQPISRPEDFHPFQSQTANSHAPLAPGLPGPPAAAAQAIPHTTYMAAAPPGTTNDAISSLPPPPSTSFNGSQPFASLAHVQPTAPAGGNLPGDGHRLQAQQAWEAFQADEKRYMTEAKWERFPDGSRIFIGEFFCSPRHFLDCV